jgi:hypothetical protein
MTRFALTVGILAFVFLGEVYFFMFADYSKPVSDDAKPVVTPLLFPEMHWPKPQAYFRPLFTPGKDATTQSQRGFHLLGTVAEGDVYFALLQAPSGTKIVKIGDTIDGARVVDIHKKDVVLQTGERQIHLRLLEKGSFDGP